MANFSVGRMVPLGKDRDWIARYYVIIVILTRGVPTSRVADALPR